MPGQHATDQHAPPPIRRPQIRLFKKGASAGNPVSFKYSGDFTDEELVRFVKGEAGIYMGLKGTLEAMEGIVEEFAAAGGDKAKREAAVAKAEKQAKGYAEGTAEADSAKYYVKTMRKTLEKVRPAPGGRRAACAPRRESAKRAFFSASFCCVKPDATLLLHNRRATRRLSLRAWPR